MKASVVVYTAIFGNHDILQIPLNYRKGDNSIQYYCITDDINFNNEVYEIIYVNRMYKDITKNARYYKVMGLKSFEEFDYSIWHDGNITIDHSQIYNLIDSLKDGVISVFVHPQRNCLYDEAISCIKLNKDYSLRIFLQMVYYWMKGLKGNSGLVETGILVKDNFKLANSSFKKIWWNQILNFSRRDQISIMYAIERSQIKTSSLIGRGVNNPYSIYIGHNKKHYDDTSIYKLFNGSFIKKVVIAVLVKLKNSSL